MGRRRSGAGGAALLVAVASLVLAGCTAAGASHGAAQDGEPVAPWGGSTTQFLTAVPFGDDGLFIMRPRPPRNSTSGSGSALVSGGLGMLSGGCFGLLPDTVVVWPAGTTALPDGTGVRLAGGEELRRGDSLETGGSYGGVAFSGPASSCPGTGVAYVSAPSS
ncbi:hypothetical protein [Quadrisphaera setariae]|uniref:hypothetical protein n=1 Tax=Quadrisphaera setariae TaxID=2593304 RepID=UPI001C9C65C6|nr:hypothetical protein [Quadrisphaera setariae]